MTIMVGRPRKKGRRQPNGQLARAYVNPKQQIMEQPHRVVVPLKFRERPEAESEFGRLMLNDKISLAQYEAGRLYADLASRYRVVLDIPPLHPVGMDLMRSGGRGAGVDPVVARSIKDRYKRAFIACAEAGNRAQRAVKDHAVFERRVPDGYALSLLISGLDKLVSHFGLDVNLKMSKSRT